MRNDEDQQPQIVDECRKRNGWPKRKEASNSNKAKLVNKMRYIWTCSLNT